MSKPQTPMARWRSRLGLTQRAAAAELGISFTTYQQWEHGLSRQTGEPVDAPMTGLLAAAAIEAGVDQIE